MDQTWGFGAALILAIVHLLAGKLVFLEGIPRSRWLSAAGGISVAYVFLHLLPELGEGRAHLEHALPGLHESTAYLIALVGLTAFYGLERHTRRDRGAGGEPRKGDASRTSARTFSVSIAAFAVYNVLVGHVVVRREDPSGAGLALYTVALALHFVVNDVGLREHHKRRYHAVGRWVLSAAVLVGAAVGVAVQVPETVIVVVTAFLAGGIVLNVLKEELPTERQSRFWSFCAGAAAFAALLMAEHVVTGADDQERAAGQAREASTHRDRDAN